MFKQINWKQPKYMIPAIAFPILIFIGYQICSVFDTDTAPNEQAVVTQGVNTDMPGINEEKTRIKGKYESMLDGFGQVKDYTGVDNVEKEEDRKDLQMDAVYNDDEKRRIDSLNMVNMQKAEQMREELEREKQRLARQTQRNERNIVPDRSGDNRVRDRYDERTDQLTEQLRLVQKIANGEKILTEEEKLAQLRQQIVAAEQKRLRDSIAEANKPVEVNKAGYTSERYFNTVAKGDDNPNLIKARIDEMVKVKDGSRLRLRLSEDVEIEGEILPKGSYLYAMVTGFSAQRVKCTVQSVLLGGSIRKVELQVYDVDCMEGLYVPSSAFREVSQQIGAGAIGGINVNTNTSGNQNLESVAMQALQQAFSTTTSAVGSHIRKNRARIKYNTEVYLVDSSNL